MSVYLYIRYFICRNYIILNINIIVEYRSFYYYYVVILVLLWIKRLDRGIRSILIMKDGNGGKKDEVYLNINMFYKIL